MKAVGQFFLHLIGSIINVSSDAINSLDMIGCNVSNKVGEGINTVTDGIMDGIKGLDAANITNSTSIDVREDVIWGSMGLILVFLPGVPFLITYGSTGSIKETVIAVGSFFCFPFALITIQMLAVCGIGEEFLPSLIAVEAVFQCFPQLVLQFFIIIYDYPITPVLIITICSSFLVLLKNAIMYDKESITFKDWQGVIRYSFKIVPIYVIFLLFRVGCYSILLAYLRFWALIPLGLLIIELWILARFYIDYSPVDAMIATIMNIGMMNMGKRWRDTDVSLSMKMAWHGKWNLTRDMRFIKWSTITIFFHLFLTMSILIMMVNTNPEMMDHWPALILHPTSCHKFDFNVVCGSVLACGAVNVLLMRF